MKNESHEIILKQVCKEIDQLAEQIQKNNAMGIQDLEKLDKLYHLKKSMLTVEAMEDAEEYMDDGYSKMSGEMNQNGNSGYRGRAMNGRFVSRDSYADGYNRGYSEAMNEREGNSGHYPMMPYGPRRW